MTIEDLRKQYLLSGLAEADMDQDPLNQFNQWFEQAKQIQDPCFEVNAMALATCDRTSGRVSNRIVLLKKFDRDGFRFFTNYESVKANQLESNPFAALLFYWPHLERQIRIEGSVTKTSTEESKKYFDARPRKSRVSAIASPQSHVVSNRLELESAVEKTLETVGDGEIPLPNYWGGFQLKPSLFEFWQGRENRLHDRLQYVLTDDQWQLRRLGP